MLRWALEDSLKGEENFLVSGLRCGIAFLFSKHEKQGEVGLIQSFLTTCSAIQDGQYLIYAICHSEPLVRWCLSHGARVSYPDADPNLNPPLTEVIATRGTTATLKLVLEHGAELRRRTLHRAVEGAASASFERRGLKMEMVEFLVEELKVDVNAMDVPEGEQRPNHWGTAMAYAVPIRQGTADQGVAVVEYLLKVGLVYVSQAVVTR